MADYSKPQGAFEWLQANWKNILVYVALFLIGFALGAWIL